MPCIIICTYPDGRVMVNAMPEAPPEFLQDAQPAANLDDALKAAKEVLQAGGGTEPEEGVGGDGISKPTGGTAFSQDSQALDNGGQDISSDTRRSPSPMQEGYRRGKRGL